MAYAALSSLAQTTHQILNHDQYLISHDEKQQVTLLRGKVIFLREAFHKFPKQASSLEARIRGSANQAEDIIEHFMYDQIWNHYYSTTNNPHHLHNDLEKAMEEINSISREAEDFTTEDSAALGDDDSPTVRISSSMQQLSGGITVGLDEDLLKIVDSLNGGSSNRQIIPIVGMGGIGKTTLAQKVYHHPKITETFEIRAWVTVSQDYKAQNIYSDLLACFEEVGIERFEQSNECLEVKVHKILKGRKYLIVLDDMWSQNAWDDVNIYFPDDGNGSRIVITTRLVDVASYSSSHLHQMRFMDQHQSWDLLKKKVFPSKDCPSHLEEIGVEIARRSGGLPLAIVLVAGMLSAVSETEFSWKQVAEKVGSAGELEKIISLSYTNLPHHLRSCFLYVAAFPEDYEIRASKLIKLWSSEGFVEPRAGRSLEEWAIEYLEDLVKRSLVLVKERKSDGKIKKCSVHDLVREICRRRAEEENIQHRVSIAHPDLFLLARTYCSTLRSVICFQLISASSLDALRVFKLLRVLDVVDDCNEHPLPAQVFDLFHLRYLAFACPNEIPAAISRLRNLRTLIICPRIRLRRYIEDVVYLPLEIWTMPLLTHLVSYYSLLPDPGVTSPLNRLLELSVGRRFVCTKEITEMIPNVRKLGITYFGGKFRENYQLYNLVFLHHLEKLKLVMEDGYVIPRNVRPVFPESLRKLTLNGWRFPWKYMETIGSLPNLQVLKLRNGACRGRTWETKEDQFPSLEFLEINKCNLKNWVTQGSHFPRLKCLVLFDCSRLSKIPSDIGHIPTLELIDVYSVHKSLVKCVKRIQEEQRECGNDALQVHCTRYRDWKNLMGRVTVTAPATIALIAFIQDLIVERAEN
ncbi:putative late blight resistance protein homolog R1B-14 [Salvia miltiorrhiza]|uniref:putative late blight resistance protein homolog R1B-14 n=1 Tax=Salvia miltiorrhiza TaxID=226208 RepID=UPI0025ACACD6|nr:putative late blight resistance protein homolog R1B-14 [Salvia miltiorrhiza]XP_057792309.1 putative late blight resistance protein homolog R1B-14 [Salvia miltiorrhiza]